MTLSAEDREIARLMQAEYDRITNPGLPKDTLKWVFGAIIFLILI